MPPTRSVRPLPGNSRDGASRPRTVLVRCAQGQASRSAPPGAANGSEVLDGAAPCCRVEPETSCLSRRRNEMGSAGSWLRCQSSWRKRCARKPAAAGVRVTVIRKMDVLQVERLPSLGAMSWVDVRLQFHAHHRRRRRSLGSVEEHRSTMVDGIFHEGAEQLSCRQRDRASSQTSSYPTRRPASADSRSIRASSSASSAKTRS